jgi:hypothetical protein
MKIMKRMRLDTSLRSDKIIRIQCEDVVFLQWIFNIIDPRTVLCLSKAFLLDYQQKESLLLKMGCGSELLKQVIIKQNLFAI